jgi:hypothetical protein
LQLISNALVQFVSESDVVNIPPLVTDTLALLHRVEERLTQTVTSDVVPELRGIEHHPSAIPMATRPVTLSLDLSSRNSLFDAPVDNPGKTCPEENTVAPGVSSSVTAASVLHRLALQAMPSVLGDEVEALDPDL